MKTQPKDKPELQNWYKDRYQHVLVQRKALALVTVLALVGTLVMGLVILMLIPQKSIEPYVVQVDARSGVTQMVDPATRQDLTADQALNNFFIVEYIRAREGYNAATVRQEYNQVRLMSDERAVYARFFEDASPNNPKSSMARLGATGTRDVRIQSILYPNPKQAQVRIIITERTDRAKEIHGVVLLNFDYVPMNLSPEERYINPLGFQVTSYQFSEDIVQQ